MRTAQEMYDRAIEHGWNLTLVNSSKKYATELLQSFELVGQYIKDDEQVIDAFTSTDVRCDGSPMIGSVAVVFTDKRLIVGMKSKSFKDPVKVIRMDTIHDVEKKAIARGIFGAINGVPIVRIDALKEQIDIECKKDSQDAVFQRILELIENYKSVYEKNDPAPQVSAADELLKFKQLLDAGVITQDEFDAKKKQLLNL